MLAKKKDHKYGNSMSMPSASVAVPTLRTLFMSAPSLFVLLCKNTTTRECKGVCECMSVCMHVYLCMHANMHICYSCIEMRMRIHVYITIYVRVYVNIRAGINAFTYITK